MTDFSIEADLSVYDAEALAAKITEGETAFDALLAKDEPTDEDVAQAEAIFAALTTLRAEQATRTTPEQRAAKMAALREQATAVTPQDAPAPQDAPVEPEPVVEATAVLTPQDAPAPTHQQDAPVAPTTTVATLAHRVSRPVVPQVVEQPSISITASADVPGFATGAPMDGWDAVTEGFISKSRAFPTAYGVKDAALQRYPVSQFHLAFPEELVASGNRDFDVIDYASRESRLPGNSLTASGGWCAPSETLYDLCGGGSADNLWSLPEIQVSRGGVRFTRGPDFSALYAAPFFQTEAQAISGTAKTCYEIPCPTFEEIRLGVAGICLTSPILTEVGYPELVAAFLREAMIAHQHAVTARLLNEAVTAATDVTITGRGSTASDLLDIIGFIADQARASFRVANSATIEVVLPFWVKGAIRADLSMRSGVELLAVSDAQISSYFAARGVSVQFIFSFQPLEADAAGYPATVDALVYPAGTFVKGTSSVISLDAVYDAASLKQNLYTALFFEQGVALLTKCYTAYNVTIDLCSGGITGAATNEACLTEAVGP